MTLTVLVDNNTLIDRYFTGEPAVAFHLDTGHSRVLFDAGYSDAFLRNASAMDVDLLSVDAVVLSHGHIDHTGGLEALIKLFAERWFGTGKRPRPALISHPAALRPKLLEDGTSIGLSTSESVLHGSFEVRTTREPVWIDDRLVFLGEIDRTMPFEHPVAIGYRLNSEQNMVPDIVPDDSAMVFLCDDGIIVITGCSHSGICNIVETARRVTGVDRVIDIIGGFHLQNPARTQLDGTVAYIRSLGLRALHASHCTDLASKVALAAVAPLRETGCGLRLDY